MKQLICNVPVYSYGVASVKILCIVLTPCFQNNIAELEKYRGELEHFPYEERLKSL